MNVKLREIGEDRVPELKRLQSMLLMAGGIGGHPGRGLPEGVYAVLASCCPCGGISVRPDQSPARSLFS